jgi:uncharacterized membrane protein YhdT
MGLIEKIQKQPQAAKIKIMWAVSITIIVLLVVVWVVAARFHKNAPVDTSVFKTIGNGIEGVKNNYGK